MEWIKLDTIREAAKTGHIAAIKCSLDHWRQIASATQEEMIQLEEADTNMLRQKGCSLCQRYFAGESRFDKRGKSLGCTHCPLREKGTRWGCRGGSLWSEASNAFYNWLNCRHHDNSGLYWTEWLRKATKLTDRLATILAQARERNKVRTK